MEVKLVNLAAIKPYFNNPRNNSEAIGPVAASISKYGFRKPLLVDKDGVIISGHTRYFAAIQIGLEEVPVIYSDMDEHHAQMFRIADNKTAEKSTIDEDKLMEELKTMNVGNLQDFFFEDLNEMLNETPTLGFGSDGSNSFGFGSENDDEDEETQGEGGEKPADGESEETHFQDLYKVRVVDGVKKMWVACPYCGEIEEITLS